MSLSPHRECGIYLRAALINFFVQYAALIRVSTVYIIIIVSVMLNDWTLKLQFLNNTENLLWIIFDLVCQALSVCDDHISLYQLTLERGTPLFKSVKLGKLVRELQNSQNNCNIKLTSTLNCFYYINKSNFPEMFYSAVCYSLFSLF